MHKTIWAFSDNFLVPNLKERYSLSTSLVQQQLYAHLHNMMSASFMELPRKNFTGDTSSLKCPTFIYNKYIYIFILKKNKNQIKIFWFRSAVFLGPTRSIHFDLLITLFVVIITSVISFSITLNILQYRRQKNKNESISIFLLNYFLVFT